MKVKAYLYGLALFVALGSCSEESRFETGAKDKTPPSAVDASTITWEPLNGGARFRYTIPSDEDLMSIDAEFTNKEGKTFKFTSSYYKDSLDVYGLGDTLEHVINLYAVDRAGNRSAATPVTIVPLEPAISRVEKSMVLKPGFGSFFVDWTNQLEQIINVYIYFKFNDKATGADRDLVQVFSSNSKTARQFVRGLNPTIGTPVNIGIRVEDQYGNTTELMNFGDIMLQEDEVLDKSKWYIPEANDQTIVLRDGTRYDTGVPAMFGDNLEGRMSKLIDGIIDRGDNLNFFHTGGRGRTGNSKDGNMPWNIIIDLGDYYQLSRINTVQRHSGGLENISRGQYYQSENCGEFALYYFDEDSMKWSQCSLQRTPIPQGKTELQIVILGEAGDETFFYPDDPHFTKAARWFRYEGLHCFDSNYSSTGANCMSELTLYGRKAQ